MPNSNLICSGKQRDEQQDIKFNRWISLINLIIILEVNEHKFIANYFLLKNIKHLKNCKCLRLFKNKFEYIFIKFFIKPKFRSQAKSIVYFLLSLRQLKTDLIIKQETLVPSNPRSTLMEALKKTRVQKVSPSADIDIKVKTTWSTLASIL